MFKTVLFQNRIALIVSRIRNIHADGDSRMESCASLVCRGSADIGKSVSHNYKYLVNTSKI